MAVLKEFDGTDWVPVGTADTVLLGAVDRAEVIPDAAGYWAGSTIKVVGQWQGGPAPIVPEMPDGVTQWGYAVVEDGDLSVVGALATASVGGSGADWSSVRGRLVAYAYGPTTAAADGVQPLPPTPLGGSSGASEPSVKVVKCDFAFDTPDLLTGAVVYTPTVGDVLLDAWIAVTTPWDGTTPMGDFGTFDVVGWGTFFALLSGHAVDMTAGGAGEVVSNALHNAASGITFAGPSDIFQAQVQFATGVGSISELSPEIRHFPAEFVTADPIKVVVSQDGTNTGADTASSAGAASLYLVVATPVVPS